MNADDPEQCVAPDLGKGDRRRRWFEQALEGENFPAELNRRWKARNQFNYLRKLPQITKTTSLRRADGRTQPREFCKAAVAP